MKGKGKGKVESRNALINICHAGYKAKFAGSDFAYRRVNWIVHWPDSENGMENGCEIGIAKGMRVAEHKFKHI